MPDIAWNKATWDGAYNWAQAGNEWSGPWGSSEAMWFATIMPRIAFALPANSVLEIAPGHGRCSEFLMRFSGWYQGIDLSAQCVTFCRQRFAARHNARFDVNDGRSLAAAGNQKFDLVFSFDSLVHADLDAVAAYVPQIIAQLQPGGIAFIQHSNLAAYPGAEFHHRSTEVSADIVAGLVVQHGGRMLVQEVFGGDGNRLSDCFSTFCRADDHVGATLQKLRTPNLAAHEGSQAREKFAPYLALRTSP